MEKHASSAAILALLTLLAASIACQAPGPPLPPEESVTVPGEGTVVVYVEAPRSRAGPILTSFEEQSGIDVQAEYLENLGDSFFETLKTETEAGRVDLFWGISPLTAMDLQRAGLAVPFRPVGARPVPAQYFDREFHWVGFAVNPRVIIYNNIRVKREEAPQTLRDLTRPPWGGRGAMARIRTGTPAYHAAALFSLWGAERGREFFDAVVQHGNRVAEDDRAVLSLVTSGEALWGFIDLDLAICAKRLAEPVNIFFPDRLGVGAVVAPDVAVLLRDAPHLAQAKGLFAYLFTTEAAWMLGQHDCAMLTLLPGIEKPEWVPGLGNVNVTLLNNETIYQAYRENAVFFTRWGGDRRERPPDE